MIATLGDRLTAVRLVRGFTEAALAKRAGFQPSAISHFESGRRRPSVANVVRLADALDCTTDFLLGRAELWNETSGETFVQEYEKLTARDRRVIRALMQELQRGDDGAEQDEVS